MYMIRFISLHITSKMINNIQQCYGKSGTVCVAQYYIYTLYHTYTVSVSLIHNMTEYTINCLSSLM